MLARSALLFGVAAFATTTHALFLSIPEPPTNTTAAIGVLAGINLGGPNGKRALGPLFPRQSAALGDPTACAASCSSASDTSALSAGASCTTFECGCSLFSQVSSGCLQCIVDLAGSSVDDVTQLCQGPPTTGVSNGLCSTQCTAAGDAAAIDEVAACSSVTCICSAVDGLDTPCLTCLLDAAQLSAADQADLAQQCGLAGAGASTGTATGISGTGLATSTGGLGGVTATPGAGSTLSQAVPSSVGTTTVASTTSAPTSQSTRSATTSSLSSSASSSASASGGVSGAGLKVGGTGPAACAIAMALAMVVTLSV